MGKKVKISVVILVGGNYDKNLLKKCLESVSWCDEVIKVETKNVRGGFAAWRNEGAKRASGDWLLYVDTDEEITPKLKSRILQVTSSDEFSGYAIPRRNIFLGHEMRWGGWWPDYVLRLIKKDKLKGWYGELHEQPKITGEICHLNEPLIHRSHRSLTEMVDKTNEWSEVEAKLLYDAHHPRMNFLRFASAAVREFWHRGVMNLGFLDGKVGVIETIYQVYSRLITYAKLWELQIRNAGGNS